MTLAAAVRTSASAPGRDQLPVSAWVSSVLLLLAFGYAQPNILSGGSLTPSIFLAATAMCVVLINDGGSAKWLRSSGALILLVLAASLWQVMRAGAIRREFQPIALGALALIVVLVAVGFLISDYARAKLFTRLLVVVLAALSASSVVTALLATGGIVVEVGSFPLGTVTGRLLFPFTPTYATQTAFDVVFPRFIGLGREAGWMGMYGAAAFFLVPRAFKRRSARFLLSALLIAGVLTTLSTAGFAIFVVTLSVLFMTSIDRVKDAAVRMVLHLLALGLIVASFWVAWNAPILGLADKSVQNAASLTERTRLTDQGWSALQSLTLGAPSNETNAGISALASVVEWGWPYLLLIMAAILVPLLVTKSRAPALAPVGVIAATLLLFQPPSGSTGAYAFVMLACALTSREEPR